MCPRKYLCPFEGCEDSFMDVNQLEKHQNTHTFKPGIFACDQPDCHKSYSYKCHLKRHVEKNHKQITTNSTYPCKLCPKILKTQDTLTKHVKRIHSDNKIKCTHCGKEFNKVQHLKIHEYNHTGIKPFICSSEGCGKSYLLPSRLKRHEKTHEGYKCTEENCGLSFTTWTLLQNHSANAHVKSKERKFTVENYAEQYECKICGRCFLRKSNLINHSSTHNDQRECFQCPYENCPRYYYFKNNLDQHIRSFHEDKKLPCPNPKCSQKFCNKVKLEKHLKSKICEKIKKPKKKKRKRSLAAKLSGFTSDDGNVVSSASDTEIMLVNEKYGGNSDVCSESPNRSVA